MAYILTYFGAKFTAIKGSFGLIKEAWDDQIWLAVFLMTLLTIFCIVGGVLLLPIDIIVGAVAWRKDPWSVIDAYEELRNEFDN
jgi:hypothetical protein